MNDTPVPFAVVRSPQTPSGATGGIPGAPREGFHPPNNGNTTKPQSGRHQMENSRGNPPSVSTIESIGTNSSSGPRLKSSTAYDHHGETAITSTSKPPRSSGSFAVSSGAEPLAASKEIQRLKSLGQNELNELFDDAFHCDYVRGT